MSENFERLVLGPLIMNLGAWVSLFHLAGIALFITGLVLFWKLGAPWSAESLMVIGMGVTLFCGQLWKFVKPCLKFVERRLDMENWSAFYKKL